MLTATPSLLLSARLEKPVSLSFRDNAERLLLPSFKVCLVLPLVPSISADPSGEGGGGGGG